MTKKIENFSIHYFLTRALFLGIGFSLILKFTRQDSLFSFLVGTVLSLPFILMINKINKEKRNQSLSDYLKEMKFLGVIIRILFLIFGILLLSESLVFMQLFVSSFVLIKTPLFFISLPMILILIKLSLSKKDVLFRVSACLFPISLFLTLISLLGLSSYASLDNLKPFFVSDVLSFIQSVFYYMSLSISPSVLMLITTNEKNVKSYLLGSFTLIAKLFLILAIIGPILARLYRFPEYIILKEIKLLNFIEKIENIVALSWVIDVFVYMATSSEFIKELLPKKKKKWIHIALILVLYVLAFKFLGKYYTNEILIYYFLPMVTAGIFLITVPLLFFKSLKK